MQLPTYPKSYTKFVDDTIKKASDNNINIRVTDQSLVYSDPSDLIGSVGYFSSDLREMAISVYDKDITKWMGLLIHESCHMDQFLEDKTFWNRCGHGLNNFFEWLDHRVELTPGQIKKSRELVVALELDCEKER